MTTPDEALAALVAHAERVVERVNKECSGSTASDLALSLAAAVIKHGKVVTEAR